MKRLLSIYLIVACLTSVSGVHAQKKITSYKLIQDYSLVGDYELSYDEKGRLATLRGYIGRNSIWTDYSYSPGKITAKMTIPQIYDSEEALTFEMILNDLNQVTSIQIVEDDKTYSSTFSYDQEGHLLKKKIDTDKDDILESSFIWTDGNISQAYSILGQRNDISYQKADTPTGINFGLPLLSMEGSFSPHWPFYLNGYFGKAPRNLISSTKSASDPDDDEDEESIEHLFEYVMDSDGYPIEIKIQRKNQDEDESTILLFTYE